MQNHQGYRIFNTWMGDPSKVILLEAMLKVIRDEDLLTNVTRVGKKLVQGMTDLQVYIDHWCAGETGVQTVSYYRCYSRLRQGLV